MPNDSTLIVSSDGHATAIMRDWRPFLPARALEDFDEFCALHDEVGSRNFEPRALAARLDPEEVDEWDARFIKTGRLEGDSDPTSRLAEMDAQGIAAEVLFPDFGLPFQLFGGATASGAARRADPSQEQIDDGNVAFNRWLAEFCGVAPSRWAGMASLSFSDVERTMDDIRWARNAGLRGIVLPNFDDSLPVFHPQYDPIWSLLEELEMPVNCHSGISSITKNRPRLPVSAHPGAASPILVPQVLFITQQLLTHLIWGGVLERHPRLKVVLTEVGTAWVVPTLAGMDHSYERSYLRRDVREVVPRLPSEYFERQCFVGSSIYSRAEIEFRHSVGVHKMMLGMDYPHHEGTLRYGTLDYLQATLGAAAVERSEAKRMLGETAVEVFGFDPAKLATIAAEVGPSLDVILTPPGEPDRRRGDVLKPLTYVS